MIDHSVSEYPDEIFPFPFAGLLEREDLLYLGRLVEWRSVRSGECLWREGDRDDRLGMVVQGRIKLLQEGPAFRHPVDLGQFGPGSLLIDFLVEEELFRGATARAVEPSEIVFLSRPQFETVLAERPDLANRILSEALITLGEQLRHAYRRLAPFL